jgi:hypothetical protein
MMACYRFAVIDGGNPAKTGINAKVNRRNQAFNTNRPKYVRIDSGNVI